MLEPIRHRAHLERAARRLAKEEKNADVKRRLVAAGIKVIGQRGYAEASVARITLEADVALGTFYVHFESRQAFLNHVLTTIGNEIIENVRDRMHAGLSDAECEVERWQAFFDVISIRPELFRIVSEAELFAAEGYQRLINEVVAGYLHALRQAIDPRDPNGFSDKELEVVVHILIGARLGAGKVYASSARDEGVPHHFISAYAKLISRGLFGGHNRGDAAALTQGASDANQRARELDDPSSGSAG